MLLIGPVPLEGVDLTGENGIGDAVLVDGYSAAALQQFGLVSVGLYEELPGALLAEADSKSSFIQESSSPTRFRFRSRTNMRYAKNQ